MSDSAVCARFVHYPLIKNKKKNKMIMKKNYFKPELVIVDIAVDNIMQITSPGYDSTEGDGSDLGAKENRGEWGNVWGGGGSN